MPGSEANFVPEEIAKNENVVENESKAQVEANLVRVKALQRAADVEFAKQSPDDFTMLSVCREYRSQGLQMTPDQQKIWLELEDKLDKVKADVISGAIPIEPTRSDYEAVSNHYERMSQLRDERGFVGKVIYDMLMSLAKKGATQTLRQRSENIEKQSSAGE